MDTINITEFSSTFSPFQVESKTDKTKFWIGVILSITSSIFIGSSFVIKKKALLRLSKDGKRANEGGYGYLKDYVWWLGLISMAVGEFENFAAYAFAPASLVSTLGVLSVLVATILASKLLKERLNFLGKLGCYLCAIGSTVIVLHAPDEQLVNSMDDLESKIIDPLFIIYVIITIVLSLILIYYFGPNYTSTSTQTLLIWIGVCSLIGSLSVMSCKGLGLAITITVSGESNEFTNWLTWFCIASLVGCITVQMNFLNKALDTFNTALVTPIYYVFFTTCVIIASAILFREFSELAIENWVGLFAGFSCVLVAIILLHFCKSYDITLQSLAKQIKIRQENDAGTIANNNETSRRLALGEFMRYDDDSDSEVSENSPGKWMISMKSENRGIPSYGALPLSS